MHLPALRKTFFCLASITLCAVLGFQIGCTSLANGVYREDLVADSGEPAYITVQHCLIAFQGTVPGPTRSREEAEQLANELFQKAQSGEDFVSIINRYTDDSPPGIYKMANHGYDGDMTSKIASRRVYERSGMVPAFGDVGFKLEVGDYGLAPYDIDKSKFGWHIIKRIK